MEEGAAQLEQAVAHLALAAQARMGLVQQPAAEQYDHADADGDRPVQGRQPELQQIPGGNGRHEVTAEYQEVTQSLHGLAGGS